MSMPGSDKVIGNYPGLCQIQVVSGMGKTLSIYNVIPNHNAQHGTRFKCKKHEKQLQVMCQNINRALHRINFGGWSTIIPVTTIR